MKLHACKPVSAVSGGDLLLHITVVLVPNQASLKATYCSKYCYSDLIFGTGRGLEGSGRKKQTRSVLS